MLKNYGLRAQITERKPDIPRSSRTRNADEAKVIKYTEVDPIAKDSE
jgi:hypothetical protein